MYVEQKIDVWTKLEDGNTMYVEQNIDGCTKLEGRKIDANKKQVLFQAYLFWNLWDDNCEIKIYLSVNR